MRIRAAQVAAVAAVLLGLVQLGRMITGETATPPPVVIVTSNEELFEQPSQVAATSEPVVPALWANRANSPLENQKTCHSQHHRQPLKPNQSRARVQSESGNSSTGRDCGGGDGWKGNRASEG